VEKHPLQITVNEFKSLPTNSSHQLESGMWHWNVCELNVEKCLNNSH